MITSTSPSESSCLKRLLSLRLRWKRKPCSWGERARLEARSPFFPPRFEKNPLRWFLLIYPFMLYNRLKNPIALKGAVCNSNII